MPKRKPEWKVIFLHRPDPLYLYNFSRMAGCTKTRDKETWDVYYSEEAIWKLAYSHHPTNYCGCGRPYNGFKFRDSFMDNPKTLEAKLAWFKLPVLCMFCYYRKEDTRGNWIPNKVRRELDLEQ